MLVSSVLPTLVQEISNFIHGNSTSKTAHKIQAKSTISSVKTKEGESPCVWPRTDQVLIYMFISQHYKLRGNLKKTC